MDVYTYELERVEVWAADREDALRVEREFGDDTAYVYIWTGLGWEQDDDLTLTVGKYIALDLIAKTVGREVLGV